MNVALLQELTEAHGVPGNEGAIRAIVRRELEGLAEHSTDLMGNVVGLKRGTKGEGARKVMLAAHMDEIGFVVKFVSDKGFLRVQPLGGWDPTQMASQRVFVHTASERLHGVLMQSRKPKHMLAAGEAAKQPTTDDFFVDVGLGGDQAKEQVAVGDMVTMNRTFQTMGDLFTCKAMDDRVAVFVMIEALKAAGPHSADIYAVATVQEEVGLRGAAASGSRIAPDVMVAIDITLANDIPGLPEELAVTRLGQGTAIKFMDSSLICHPKLFGHFRSLAREHGIAHQIEVLPAGGTDAGAVQRLHGGIPAFTLSIPTRYVHTVNETVHKGDVQASIDLLARFIETCGEADYTLD
jgi:putative aminopeptidase FrvX